MDFPIPDQHLKELLKQALIEVLSERPDLFGLPAKDSRFGERAGLDNVAGEGPDLVDKVDRQTVTLEEKLMRKEIGGLFKGSLVANSGAYVPGKYDWYEQ